MNTTSFALATMLLIMLLSCSKEKFALESTSSNQQENFVKMVESTSFKTDFVGYHPPKGKINFQRHHHDLTDKLSIADYATMHTLHAEMLQKAEKIVLEKDTNQFWLVQYIGLRYVRNYHLLDRKAARTLKRTMDLLIAAQARDLDVLVDGYLAVKKSLSPSEQQQYFNYIFTQYTTEQTLINEGVDRLLKLKVDEDDLLSKHHMIVVAKNLENRGLARQYAAQQMPELAKYNQ